MAAPTIRTRKFLTNRLLGRKQFVIDVLHPGRANVPHAELQKELAEKYRAKSTNCVFTFGFKSAYGGGKSTGFGLIYDTEAKAMAAEPSYRLVRVSGAPPPRLRLSPLAAAAVWAPAARPAAAAAAAACHHPCHCPCPLDPV